MKQGRMEHDVEHFHSPPASGESFNHTFKPPPKAQRSAAHYKVSAYAGPLEIDIYNFEDPQFANSKYVLTSPKSLEACCRLNTKPVELLHKSLEDTQKELKDSGLSYCEIYERYTKRESQRQEIIQRVRSVRQTIILDESQQLSRPADKASSTSSFVKQPKSKPQNTTGLKRSSRRTIRTPPTGATSVRSHSATPQHRCTSPSMVVDNRHVSPKRCTSKDKVPYPNFDVPTEAQPSGRDKVPYPNFDPPSEAQPNGRWWCASDQAASEASDYKSQCGGKSVERGKTRAPSSGRGSSTRSCSVGSVRQRAPWVGYICPHTPAPVYVPEIGPIHTLYVAQPAYATEERVRHGSSNLAPSSCSFSPCATPDYGSVTGMHDAPKKDLTVEQMMSQLEYTLKFAPGCQRGEGNDVPTEWHPVEKMGHDAVEQEEIKQDLDEKGLIEGDIPWAYSNASTEQMFRDMEKEVARVTHTRSRLDNFM